MQGASGRNTEQGTGNFEGGRGSRISNKEQGISKEEGKIILGPRSGGWGLNGA